MEFFEFFYKLKNFYGVELYEHLKGWDDTIMDYNPDYNQFPSICMSTFAICLIAFVLFYYVFNSPRFNRWWSWIIEIKSRKQDKGNSLHLTPAQNTKEK